MRSIVGALSVAILGLGAMPSAFAADLPVKARPAAIAAFSWTGFYIGGHVGGSWSAEHYSYSLTDPAGGAPFTSRSFATCGAPAGVGIPVPTVPSPFDLQTSCRRDSSFLAGGQIGYNWQAGAMVYGVELDGSWRELLDRRFGVFGTNPTAAGAPMGSVATDTTYIRNEQNGLGTFRGRIGYAPGNWLIYATGGLAVGNVKHSVTEVLAPGTTCLVPSAPGAPTGCRNVSDNDTNVGWTIGGGFEYALNSNWSVAAEYLYVDLGRTTLTMAPLAGATFFTNVSTTRFDDQSHVARLKLNYRFGGARL